jgi:hypothetical protein
MTVALFTSAQGAFPDFVERALSGVGVTTSRAHAAVSVEVGGGGFGTAGTEL